MCAGIDSDVPLVHPRPTIDQLPLGHQAMISADGQLSLTCDRQAYSCPSSRREPAALDCSPGGHFDAGVVLAGLLIGARLSPFAGAKAYSQTICRGIPRLSLGTSVELDPTDGAR